LNARPELFWAGSYTPTLDGTAEGIGALRPRADGSLEFLGLAAATSSPSFLANSAGRNVVYSVDEANSRVEAFARTDGIELRPLGGQATNGPLPCHISVTDDWLYVSNYGNGVIDVFPVAEDGTIEALAQSLDARGSGPRPEQAGPHAHSTLVVGSRVLSADLGTDQVYVHELRDGLLTRMASLAVRPGTGPRDLAVSADGAVVFLIGELTSSVFALDVTGDRVSIVASGQAVAEPVDGDHGAGLALSEDGHFLYSGLRGSNRIAVIRTEDLSPVAAVPCGGDWPRNLCLAGEMLYVANQRSSTIASFRIDGASGIPQLVGEPEPVPSPTFVLAAV
jgi:6-phosphogluconolactonase